MTVNLHTHASDQHNDKILFNLNFQLFHFRIIFFMITKITKSKI